MTCDTNACCVPNGAPAARQPHASRNTAATLRDCILSAIDRGRLHLRAMQVEVPETTLILSGTLIMLLSMVAFTWRRYRVVIGALYDTRPDPDVASTKLD